MIYPPQTSLIPVTVALLRYFNENGFTAFSTNYPYWYLGSTPYKFLIGPVVPLVEYLLHLISPSTSIFTFVYLLIFTSFLLDGVGWLLLIRQIFKKDNVLCSTNQYLLLTIYYFITPWKYLSALSIAEGSDVIAKNMIPFVLVGVWTYLSKKDIKSLVISSLSVAFLMLVNTNVMPTLIVGIVALCLTISFKNEKIRHLDKKLKRALLPLVIGFMLSTIWYGPGFWWVQLINPGIGGVSGVNVVFKIFDFFKNFVPLVLVVIVLNFSHKIKDRLTVFSLSWLLTFVFLTLYRFMANPDFWMDWTTWFAEVEIGIMLLLASKLQITNYKLQINSKFIFIAILPFIATLFVYNKLEKPKIISRSIPESVLSLSLVKNIPITGSTVYITGANTFWLNTFFNVKQIRGGRDEVAINPDWQKVSYTFRESKDKDKILTGINKLNVDYVLINTVNSLDFYKDFKNFALWDQIGEKVANQKGDYLLKVSKASR